MSRRTTFLQTQPMTTDDSVSNASSLTAAPTSAPRKRFFHFWRCFWLAFLVISLGYAWYCFYVPTNRVAWADDFDTAQQQAVAEGKPMVLFFTSQWCVPCRTMKRNVWADDQVSAVVNESLIPVTIDVHDPQAAATIDQYRVKATPVTVVTDSQGNPLQWKQGGISKADFLELLVAAKPSTDS
ncbi:thioredoxin family protein [Rosistilla oblonga]